ncbi:hypothetical protein [Cyanobium gracile]|uniref:Uncharacterized protein n=1 Tax=Cyanobium gracile (strain ATCC 27147 / PCC 6307) TaxID=292564 RepID=K9P868_CYAGP|nr:hypothetical protein [Cyanobium gracile]AFY29607.1 hypothetical protein Cyagr_2501 [Cyanobium gracile PCC 6307]
MADLASLHLRIWRLHLTLDLEIEERPQPEQPEPMGFGSPIDVPVVADDGDVEDRHLGFRARRP